ncbi:hypothetical protein MNBD_GAMMA05-1310 [hydrothermal vent metagenome]|uniref:DUF4878 domain-containing protein n=1 Tax=hydrothermal vent metagenome TaxID=652676 RepID=A0A3B0XDQ6_9ZZZZ
MHTYKYTILKSSFIIMLGLFLYACKQSTEDPKLIADKYWQHLQSGNTSEAEKLISTNSKRAFANHNNRIASIAQLNNSDAKTIVSTTITTINPKTQFSYTETFNTILVLQQGKWRVDVNESQIPPALSAPEEELQQLAEELSESMQDNIESIDEAMNEGMQLLNEALRDGSKEMGDSLLHMMNELNSKMHESIDMMKERRQRQTQPSQNQPDPKQGEGII